jgi:uncharacterized protein YjbI with pentapeptide repeats
METSSVLAQARDRCYLDTCRMGSTVKIIINPDTLTMKKISQAEINKLIDRKIKGLIILDLNRLDLSGLDLSGVDLSMVFLTHVNLSKTNLSHANLSHANLSCANLSGANLNQANLKYANLKKARYDINTIFPAGFNPQAVGALFTQ